MLILIPSGLCTAIFLPSVLSAPVAFLVIGAALVYAGIRLRRDD